MNDGKENATERIKALEAALVNLRERLDDVTTALSRTPGNTQLVIQRVNVMKLILQAQSEIDRLRLDPTKG